MVVNTSLEICARNKHSSLPDPFKTFEEKFPAKIRERLHGWYISLYIGCSICPGSTVLYDCLLLRVYRWTENIPRQIVRFIRVKLGMFSDFWFTYPYNVAVFKHLYSHSISIDWPLVVFPSSS